MRRRSLSVDDDSLPVIVPRNDKALVPMSAARVRRLRKHLVETLREAKALKKMRPRPIHQNRLALPLGWRAPPAHYVGDGAAGMAGTTPFLMIRPWRESTGIDHSWMHGRCCGFISRACQRLLIRIRAYFTEGGGATWIGHSVPISATATSAAASELM
jgi:hypothetical protein